MSKNSGHIICGLTEWAAPEPGGKGRQTTKQSRYVLMLSDKRNWTIAIERENSNPVGEKFGTTVGHILLGSSALTGRPFAEIIDIVVKALREVTGIQHDFKQATPLDILRSLDEVFQTNLMGVVHPSLVGFIGEPVTVEV